MHRAPLRPLIAASALGLATPLIAACGSSEDAPAGSRQLTFKLTDAGCEPTRATAPAGPIEFKVENGGTAKYTELEVLDGETILGERENVTEGLSAGFPLVLAEGEYTVRRNEEGGDGDATLVVTGRLHAKSGPEVERAVADYRRYLEQNAAELTARTKPFVAAVAAGDVARARRLYPRARVDYERIEPVAESFGDLDPRIDARENDVAGSEFGGFLRLEKALWEEGTTRRMKPVAAALREDVEELETEVEG